MENQRPHNYFFNNLFVHYYGALSQLLRKYGVLTCKKLETKLQNHKMNPSTEGCGANICFDLFLHFLRHVGSIIILI